MLPVWGHPKFLRKSPCGARIAHSPTPVPGTAYCFLIWVLPTEWHVQLASLSPIDANAYLAKSDSQYTQSARRPLQSNPVFQLFSYLLIFSARTVHALEKGGRRTNNTQTQPRNAKAKNKESCKEQFGIPKFLLNLCLESNRRTWCRVFFWYHRL